MTFSEWYVINRLGCGTFDLAMFERFADEVYDELDIYSLFECENFNQVMCMLFDTVLSDSRFMDFEFNDGWEEYFDIYFNYIDTHISAKQKLFDEFDEDEIEQIADRIYDYTGFYLENVPAKVDKEDE